MPDPPRVGLFMRYVLENPWPLGLFLLIVGGVIAWQALQAAAFARLRVAGVFALAAAGVILTGVMVETPGERAEAVVRQLVEAVAAEPPDITGAAALFTEDCTIAIGSVANQGMDKDYLVSRLNERGRYRIESNSIRMLDGHTESSDAAVVHLGCLTTVGEFPYPTTTHWVINVRRQPDDTWMITRIVWVLMDGKPATRW